MSEPNMTSATLSRAGVLPLASDEVHCWCIGLDTLHDTHARLYATLTVEERDRSARFRFQRDRQHFIVAHGALRELLGRYLQTPPGEIRYVYNAFGKPDLDLQCGVRIKFNLSHSAGRALIGIAADANVGVDLEYVHRASADYAELARHFFSTAEVAQLSSLPDHLYAEAFISCWTKKEACLKASGKGLATPLNSLPVPLITDPTQGPVDLHVTSNEIAQATRWSVHTLRPAPGYIGALAIEGHSRRLSLWH